MYKITVVNTDNNKAWENICGSESECFEWAIIESNNPERSIIDLWVTENKLSNEQLKNAVDVRYTEIEKYIYIREFKFSAIAVYKIERIK